MTPNALRQDAALVRHDRPCDQDVRQHSAERPDRSAGRRRDHGDGQHLLPPRPLTTTPTTTTRCCGRSIRAASCNSRPICWACRRSCANIRARTTTARRSKKPRRWSSSCASQFAGRLSPEEKERLRTVEGQLNLEIATRDYRMAEYYDGTKHYGAAQVLLRAGDPEVSGHGAGQAGPRAAGADRQASRRRRRSGWHGSSTCSRKAASDRAWRGFPSCKTADGRLVRQPDDRARACHAAGRQFALAVRQTAASRDATVR